MRYPLVEAATAGLFAGVAARIGFSWTLPAYLVLAAGLLALACTDMEHLLLPKRIVYPVLGLVGVLLVVAAAITGHWHNLLVAGISGAVWFVIFFTMNFLSPRALGFGDVRLAPVLGLASGGSGFATSSSASSPPTSSAPSSGSPSSPSKRMSRQQQIPYGVFLAVGTLLAIFAGPELLRPFHSLRV